MKTFIALLLCGFASFAFGQACDITLETQVIADGNAVGPGSGMGSITYFQLSPIGVQLIEAGMVRVAASANTASKSTGNHRVIMTGRKTCPEGVTPYQPVDAKGLTLTDVNKMTRAQQKEGDELIATAEKNAKGGKKTGWASKD